MDEDPDASSEHATAAGRRMSAARCEMEKFMAVRRRNVRTALP
jgi:hypothetical protein